MRLRAHLFATTMLAIAGMAGFAAPATAQTSEQTGHSSAAGDSPTQNGPQGAATSNAQADTDSQGLRDVIVTAQRQSESSQRAAVPLSVVEGGALRAAGITQVDRLNALAPALSIAPTNTGSAVFVRGVGNFTLAPSSDPAIAFNYDGVYVGRPTATTGVFYDLDRVEILKGPQGILYGRNATGGAINVLPAQPRMGELSGYASVAYGNYNTLTAEGAVNLPFGENGAARVSLARSSHDGYLSDGTSDEDTWAGRLQLKAALTPSLTVRVAGDYAHNGGEGVGIDYSGVFINGTTFVPSGIPVGTGSNSPIGQAYRQGTVFASLGNRLPPLPTPFQNNSFYGVNAQIEWNTGAGTLTVIPAWRNAQLDYLTAAGGILYHNMEKDNQYSLEARFAGTRVGPLDYQIGAYYYDEYLNVRTQVSTGNLGYFDKPQYSNKSLAGFGRLTLHVDERLRLVGGLRYTRDKKLFSIDRIGSILVCTVFVAGQRSCPNAPTVPLFTDTSQLGYPYPTGAPAPIIRNGAFTGAISIATATKIVNRPLRSGKLTYRGAVEFDLAERSLLYASVESGYRAGGFSVATGYETYRPETITAYTIGTKNRFFDNKLQLNLEGFIWKYKDQQVLRTGVDLSNSIAQFTQNIGSSTIKGFEVDGKLLVTPTTLVGADVQYLDAQQKDFTYLAPAGTPPTTGCPVTVGTGPAPYLVNCSGFPSYNSPKWTLNLSGQQTVNVGDYKLVLTADTQYRSSRYVGFQYVAQQLVKPTWTTNAQVQFGPQDERWSISGFIRNIENDRYTIYSQAGSVNFLVIGTAAPRTYGARLAAKF